MGRAGRSGAATAALGDLCALLCAAKTKLWIESGGLTRAAVRTAPGGKFRVFAVSSEKQVKVVARPRNQSFNDLLVALPKLKSPWVADPSVSPVCGCDCRSSLAGLLPNSCDIPPRSSNHIACSPITGSRMTGSLDRLFTGLRILECAGGHDRGFCWLSGLTVHRCANSQNSSVGWAFRSPVCRDLRCFPRLA